MKQLTSNGRGRGVQARTLSDDRLANPAKTIQSPFVTIKEAAEYLRISVATIYRELKKKNDFPSPHRHAGRVLYRLEELELWSLNQVTSPKCSLFQELRARSMITSDTLSNSKSNEE